MSIAIGSLSNSAPRRYAHRTFAAKCHARTVTAQRSSSAGRARDAQIFDHKRCLAVLVAEMNSRGFTRQRGIDDLTNRPPRDFRSAVKRRQIRPLRDGLQGSRPRGNPMRWCVGGKNSRGNGKLAKQRRATCGSQGANGHSGGQFDAKRALCPIAMAIAALRANATLRSPRLISEWQHRTAGDRSMAIRPLERKPDSPGSPCNRARESTRFRARRLRRSHSTQAQTHRQSARCRRPGHFQRKRLGHFDPVDGCRVDSAGVPRALTSRIQALDIHALIVVPAPHTDR